MTLLVAVSGGVDSVVLLNTLAKASQKLVVAHVDHGIRPDSAADARFVEALAKKYNLRFISTRLELGGNASEDAARQVRYKILHEWAAQYDARIVTAHHRDDMVGSIAINLTRGTGWRGLNVMSQAGIFRPLLERTKQQLYEYATKHRLEWVEDSTNASDKFLRNQLRAGVVDLSEVTAQKVTQLREAQKTLADDIDALVAELLEAHSGSRYFYTMIESSVAVELLRVELALHGQRLTIPEARRALIAIKTARPGKMIELSGGQKLRFNIQSFVVESDL